MDEASVRLPSAVQSGVAALLVTGAAAATIGPVAGGAAGVVLLSSFEWLRAATAARVDMTLAFGLTLVFVGLLLFRRRERTVWLCLVYVGAAWATLAKGIPGLAIPVLQIALLCVVDRSLAPLRRLHPLRGVLFVAIVAGAWYAAAAAQGGRAFLTIVANENFVRIVGAKSASLGHVHGARLPRRRAARRPAAVDAPPAQHRARAVAGSRQHRPARPAPLRVAVEPGGVRAVRGREQQARRLPVAAVSRRRAADRLVGAARVARTRRLGRPARAC